MKRFLMALSIAALGLAFSGTADAFTQTTTGTMNVGATVVASCTVGTTPMAYGSYTGSTAPVSTSTITVNCSTGTPYRIDIDKGLNDIGTTGADRYLKTGTGVAVTTNTIMYQLFKASTYASTELWGDNGATYRTTSATVPTGLSGTGTGAAQVLTVYGGLNVTNNAPGVYNDTVTVTVNY